jgi:hypothetical protein
MPGGIHFSAWDGPGMPGGNQRRKPKPYIPPPQSTSPSTRRRISRSEGDFLTDQDGNIIAQLPDSRSPVVERYVVEPEETDG